MARSRSRGTLIDYLVAAIEPALIMVMVGSLMFFLLDTWYEGEALERLRWILFWFVFGIVLITRISMQIGNELAKGYGLALGGAVALVGTVLAGFQPFLLVVMGVVWWATHKLTFDCTLLDEDQDAGVGLLQQSGLDTAALADDGPDIESIADPDEMDTSLMPDRPSWKFWATDGEGARRPHAPGVWLIYFTVGSLPVYGLGQWLVPAVEQDRRAWMFVYFLAYIASGMGLLLATSFLNLRRYLRRRKLKMPAAMTATWLSTGAIMIVALTLVAALLPLPLNAVRGGSRSAGDSGRLRASKYAVLKDSGVQGEGARSEGAAASKAGGKQQASGKAEGSGRGNDPNAAQQVNGKGQEGGAGGQGKAKSGAAKGKPSSGSGQQGKSGAPQDQSGEGGKSDDRAKGQEGRSEPQADDKGEAAKGEGKAGEQSPEETSNPSGSPSQFPPLPPMDWLQTPIMIVGVIIVVLGLIRYGREFLEVLRLLLMALLGGLGFGSGKRREKDEADETEKPAPPPRPFSAYPNPFNAGLDKQLTPDDLVLYSFEALEAWAYEHELARSQHETPMEFASRIGEARGDLGPEAARMVGYLGMIVYGRQGFGPEVLPPLRRFWQALESSQGAVLAGPSTEP